MTLPAFAAERGLQVYQRQRCAANPLLLPIDGTDRRTD